jgi:hypothetical protein
MLKDKFAAATRWATLAVVLTPLITAYDFQEAQKKTCGCGDICNEKTGISCRLPGCAMEHHKPGEATFFEFDAKINKVGRAIRSFFTTASTHAELHVK